MNPQSAIRNPKSSADSHLSGSYVDRLVVPECSDEGRFEVIAAGEILEFFESAREALDYAHEVAAATLHPAEIFDARRGLALLIVEPPKVA